MKKVQLGDGISLSVPGNFPKQVVENKEGIMCVSFSMRVHKDAPRFVHFFEIVLSDKKGDFMRKLPEKGYKTGNLTQEEVAICGGKASLESGELEITLPCGGKIKSVLYALQYYFKAKNKYLTIVTFTMTKNGLLEIIKTIRCQ